LLARHSTYSALIRLGKKGPKTVFNKIDPRRKSLPEDNDGQVPDITGGVIALMESSDPAVVKETIPRVVELLEDKDAEIRGNAALALGRVGAEEALANLRELLIDDAVVSIDGEETTVGEVARKAIERIEEKYAG